MDPQEHRFNTHSISVAKACHALLTLLSFVLMTVAFSHPLQSGEMRLANAANSGTRDSRLAADAASLDHIIVPAKEFLRKAQASKSQPKKWYPAGPPLSPADHGFATAGLARLDGTAVSSSDVDVFSKPCASPANPARAPPFPLFLC